MERNFTLTGLNIQNHWHFSCEQQWWDFLGGAEAYKQRGMLLWLPTVYTGKPAPLMAVLPELYQSEGGKWVASCWLCERLTVSVCVFPDSVVGKHPSPISWCLLNHWWFSEMCKVLFCVHVTKIIFSSSLQIVEWLWCLSVSGIKAKMHSIWRQKASLVYTASSRTAKATQRTCVLKIHPPHKNKRKRRKAGRKEGRREEGRKEEKEEKEGRQEEGRKEGRKEMEDRVHERVKALRSVLTSNFTANNVVEGAGLMPFSLEMEPTWNRCFLYQLNV